MKTENQNIHTEKKSFLKSTKSTSTKRASMKSLSLKPTRSLKKSMGLRPLPLKLK